MDSAAPRPRSLLGFGTALFAPISTVPRPPSLLGFGETAPRPHARVSLRSRSLARGLRPLSQPFPAPHTRHGRGAVGHRHGCSIERCGAVAWAGAPRARPSSRGMSDRRERVGWGGSWAVRSRWADRKGRACRACVVGSVTTIGSERSERAICHGTTATRPGLSGWSQQSNHQTTRPGLSGRLQQSSQQATRSKDSDSSRQNNRNNRNVQSRVLTYGPS